MKKVTLAMFMAFLLLLTACGGDADVSQVIEDVAQEVGDVADQVGENADEIAAAVEDAADTAVETAEDVMMSGLEELTVAYFLEWPTPNQFAQIQKTYDDALGIPVNWVSFDTGVAMSAAMASGDVHIAYSQGLVPFANAVSAGVDLQTVGIAVSYAENDNCVAATDLGITRDNVTDLHGLQVAVPIGTVAHYKMLKQMEYLGVDVAQLELVDLAPADGAAALQRGDVSMACGWGGGLARMKENGNIIMTGAEMEAEIGLKVFDVVSVTGDFAKDHGDVITAFLQVTEDANAMFAADSAPMMEAIAEAAGMDMEATESNLATFSFPTAEEQLSDAWLGGTVQNFVKEVADFFVEQGELEASLDSYDAFINTSFLENVDSASSMMMDDGAMADGSGMKVCQITDVGGIDDKSFNATAWLGVELSTEQFGVEGKFLESQQQADYEKNIDAFVGDSCDLIVTVGFLLGDATAAAAEANPDQDFVILDVAYDPPIENVQGVVFASNQNAFLAGYAAASVTETGIVATYGGINIPPVTDFMDGYILGIDYFNAQNGTDIQVLGWDVEAQDGLFTGNFESTDDGRALAESLMDEGADVIFPLAGAANIGTASAVQERGGAWVIGVDSDFAAVLPEFADVIFMSTLKRLDTAVISATEAKINGTFEGGTWVGTLENDGVGITEPTIEIPGLEDVRAGIIAGSIVTAPGGEAMAPSDEGAMMEAPEIDPVKIAIVMPSATTDLAWSQSIYDALVTVQGMYDEGVVEIEFTEGMFIVTDAAAALRDYADGGANIVIAHGTQFGTSLFELAPDFEDTSFLYGTSTNPGTDEGLTNISAYDAQAQQGGYVNGVIAASLSESGIIGVVGPVEAGDAKLYIDGFVAGAEATNPDINVQIAYTGSFGDTALAAEVANTHIASGADVLTGSAQQVVGAIGVAAENGIPWLGTQADQSPIAEDVVVATQNYDWAAMVLDVIVKSQAGEFGGDVYQLTLENSGLGMLISDSLPDDVKAAAQAAIDGIISGEIDPSGQ